MFLKHFSFINSAYSGKSIKLNLVGAIFSKHVLGPLSTMAKMYSNPSGGFHLFLSWSGPQSDTLWHLIEAKKSILSDFELESILMGIPFPLTFGVVLLEESGLGIQ